MIKVECKCGKTLSLADNLAGKFSRCPACGGTVAVPERAAGEEDEEPAPDRTALEVKPERAAAAPRPVVAPPKKGAPPQVACPKCGALFPVDTPFCNKCAIMIATGQPIAGVVPGGMSAPRKAKRDLSWVKWAVIGAVLVIGAVVALKMRH